VGTETGGVQVSTAQVRAMAEAVQLELPPERVEALVDSLSAFLAGFEKLHALDVGDLEPATLTYGEEEDR
jgi:Asp-tRNA(Asn)/Glu-tRNA(Gln) amidotransferase C subunit